MKLHNVGLKCNQTKGSVAALKLNAEELSGYGSFMLLLKLQRSSSNLSYCFHLKRMSLVKVLIPIHGFDCGISF